MFTIHESLFLFKKWIILFRKNNACEISAIDSVNITHNNWRVFGRNIFPPQELSARSIEILLVCCGIPQTPCIRAAIVILANLPSSHAWTVVYNSGGPARSPSRESLRMLALQVMEVPESALQISPAAVYSLSTVDTNCEL